MDEMVVIEISSLDGRRSPELGRKQSWISNKRLIPLKLNVRGQLHERVAYKCRHVRDDGRLKTFVKPELCFDRQLFSRFFRRKRMNGSLPFINHLISVRLLIERSIIIDK